MTRPKKISDRRKTVAAYVDKFAPRAKLDTELQTFHENLKQQSVNQQKQMELIEAEKSKIQIATEKEQILLEMAKEEAVKSKKIADIEIKQKEHSFEHAKLLDAIEADKMKRLAELEIEAKKRQLNL